MKNLHVIKLLGIVVIAFLLSCTDEADIIIINQESTVDKNIPELGTLVDIEGNVYHTIKIGNQWWMRENLKTTKYNDGTSIARIDSDSAWFSTTKGAYCYYDNKESYADTFGLL